MDVILHNYPQSPVAEKVRRALGVKNLTWKNVLIPRIPPKPDLMPLTGGYRRTPVMQIGADIYCDSQCILLELERRFPDPSFHVNGGTGLDWGLNTWNDQILFTLAAQLVIGSNAADLPEDFAQDRGRLYFGPDADLQHVASELPHVIAQLRGALAWWEAELLTGKLFLSGARAGLADILAGYLIWFLRGRWSGGPDLIAQFPNLIKWEARAEAVGHGTHSELSSLDALDIAKNAQTTCKQYVDGHDPQNLKPGQQVSIIPDSDGGDPVVTGKLHYADAHTIAILHSHDRVGEVCIHFPRIGYRVLDTTLTGN